MPKKEICEINRKRCTFCGLCADVCPTGAVSEMGLKKIDPNKCTGCGLCLKYCPSNAIVKIKYDADLSK